MKQVPKPGAEFYLIWYCPYCTISVPRTEDEGVEHRECENCNDGDGPERQEAWIMTPDIEDRRLHDLRRVLNKYIALGATADVVRTRAHIKELTK